MPEVAGDPIQLQSIDILLWSVELLHIVYRIPSYIYGYNILNTLIHHLIHETHALFDTHTSEHHGMIQINHPSSVC